MNRHLEQQLPSRQRVVEIDPHRLPLDPIDGSRQLLPRRATEGEYGPGIERHPGIKLLPWQRVTLLWIRHPKPIRCSNLELRTLSGRESHQHLFQSGDHGAITDHELEWIGHRRRLHLGTITQRQAIAHHHPKAWSDYNGVGLSTSHDYSISRLSITWRDQ